MKSKIKILYILLLVSIIITTFSIRRTYAKYRENIKTNFQATINQWRILLNEEDIKQNKNLTEYLNFSFDESNKDVDVGAFAPGSMGYIILDLDYSNVGVNFIMEVTMKKTENNLSNFRIYGYKIDNGEIITESSEQDLIYFKYTGDECYFREKVSIYTSENYKQKVTLYFKWIEMGNNSEDTAMQGKNIKYKTTVTFTQNNS